MLVSMEWLSDWVSYEGTAEDLAKTLTIAGLEVDGIATVAEVDAAVVVAEVRECRRHPNADRLHVCEVFDGTATHDIVCGAPNVAVGLRVPFAPVGSRLPSGQSIERASIRGVESEGMLCSATELGFEADSDGLLVLDPSATTGASINQALKLGDAIIDIDLTPNRGDCFSILGVARELAARASGEIRGPRIKPVPEAHSDSHPVALEAPSACPRFVSRVIHRLGPGSTPTWMTERLNRAGVRPISPVVDVTNYVMLELGQPLHAYDLDTLQGTVTARFARPTERLTRLDDVESELADDVLVIADDSGPIGLAGIMGGAGTAVGPATQSILLEAAHFAPDAIRGRPRRYGLHTDASVRFERGVDPDGPARAIERATDLIMQICGGAPGPTTIVDSRDDLPMRPAVPLRLGRITRVLGHEVSSREVEHILRRLEMSLNGGGQEWQVTPPSHRFDIVGEEDLIEEVGRMIGYDRIEPEPERSALRLGIADERKLSTDVVADALIARGYSEIVTYSFGDPADYSALLPDAATARLANPLSADLEVLRNSLWPGLLRAVQLNLSRQQAGCKLFEIGTVFEPSAGGMTERQELAVLATGSAVPEQWDIPDRPLDFYDLKSELEALLSLTRSSDAVIFEAATHPALDPGRTAEVKTRGARIGWLGALHPRLQKRFDLKDDSFLLSVDVAHAFAAEVPAFVPLSKFPSVRRDLAIIVADDVPVGDLTQSVQATLGDVLQRVIVFDLYRGESIGSRRKSVGIGLILQDASRTLTDKDADSMVDAVMHQLERTLGATIRN